MKKHAISIFIGLIILLFIGSVFAENGLTQYIPDKEVSITVPFDIACVSREADETNSFFQNEYFDYATTHNYMLNNNIYLYGMTLDNLGEFAVMITDYDAESFNYMDQLSLTVYMNELKSLLTSQGAMNVKCESYQGSKDKAICVHYTLNVEQESQYIVFYFLTHGSNLLTIRFVSFFKDFIDKQEKMIRNIVESIEWGKKDYTAGPKGKTDMNIFTDYETGLSFMVPSGWNEVKFVAGEESKKAKYRIGTENVWVLYESGDLWGTIEQSYDSLISTLKLSRADFGNDFLSKEMIMQWFDCKDDEVYLNTIGGQEYFCVKKATKYTAGNVSIENHNTIYICMRDAYLYWFQLSGVDTFGFEDQFNRFMKTIEYP